ncbi:conserved oligomeric Golgi complex subunit 8 [Planococcus citri]|uniref:conserved oligomeric Golgi complex subunit 8 n=1 Tax=Planococcus citri TaxID=170843 RepID=UPI0031F8BA47
MDYDADTEKLINHLFPDGVPEQYQDNPDFIKYLHKLGTQNIDQLRKEKKALDDETTSVNNQLRHLALSNYKSFIQTADCSHSIYKDICSVENKLQACINEIPKLLEESDRFINVSTDIKDRKAKNNMILSNNGEILQILEIPQFMNTCIRSELYEEALLLTSFVKRLSSQHGDIPLIATIAKDVDKSWWELMRHLLRHLSTDLSLPKCLQIVGYLRRMNIFSEVELRLKFLQARNQWLDALLSDIPSDNKNQYLSSVIDLTRVNIFNIVTQYKAVFTDDEIITRQNDMKNSIFQSWLNKRINDFLLTVNSCLPECSASSLDSLLDQCMYFGQSFGRIGADFRGLIITSFVSTSENNFKSAITKADQKFESSMNKFMVSKSSKTNSLLLKNELESDSQTLNPPLALLQYPPLAEYCNAILSAFNDLRFCTPSGCIVSVTETLQTSLENVAGVLATYYDKEYITWLDSEREAFVKFCSCFHDVFLVFILQCMQVLFDPVKLAKYLEVSVSQLQDEKIGFICVSDIIKPLSKII